jgi:hypothetical protein
MSALDEQVGGDHYRKMKIQPIEFILANEIPYTEGNIIKYICRWKDKGGIKDLEKIKHYCDLLIESVEKENYPLNITPKQETIKSIVVGGERIPIPEGYRVLGKNELLGPGCKILDGNKEFWPINPEKYGYNPISVCTYICPAGV